MLVRQAESSDLQQISTVYSECFPREEKHEIWVNSSFSSHPRSMYYVAVLDGEISGYVLWCVKNGFRSQCIVELEQVGVRPENSNRGIGRALISESLEYFKDHVENMGFQIGALLVTTSEANYAESLYESILGVTRVSVIPNYGSSNEAILFKKFDSGKPADC